MTHSPYPSPASVLEQIYEQQAGLYQQLLRMAKELTAAISQRKDTEPALVEIGKIMDQIGQLNHQAAPVRNQWTADGAHLTPGLAQAVKTIENLIVTSIKKIDLAETSAQKAKNEMVPKLSQENTRRKMRAAYTAAKPEH